jgi:hypothetical protein
MVKDYYRTDVKQKTYLAFTVTLNDTKDVEFFVAQ